MKVRKLGLLIGILLFVLLLSLLTGCSVKVKSEKEIAEDLSGSEFLPAAGLEIDEVEITQRRTDKADKTDLVYVDVSGSANNVQYNFSYILDYLYFDKGGWILQNAEPLSVGSWHIDPVSDADALQDLVAKCGGILSQVTVNDSKSIDTDTSPENASCQKTLRITGQGDGFHCDLTATAAYELTSHGWDCSDCYYNNIDAHPEYSMSAYELEAYVQDLYGFPAEETDVITDWDYCEETHYLVSKETLQNISIDTVVEVYCSFDPYSLSWRITDYRECETNYNWDVEGTWSAEGTADPDILYPKGFDYRVKCVVTKVDDYTFKVDFDYLNPIVPWTSRSGKKENEIDSGTVYVDVRETKDFRHKFVVYNPYPYDLYVKADLPNSDEVIIFTVENGVSITHYSWGSYEKLLTREN